MTSARILVVDDHEVVLSGIRTTLEPRSEWKVVGATTDGRHAVELAQQLRPDVVIMDLALPTLNGLEATRRILKRLPATRVLILTVYESEQTVREVLNAGAQGYLLKSDAGRELIAAVEALLADKPYFTSKVARMVLEGYVAAASPSNAEVLSAREREIVQLLAEGRTTKQAAVALGISTKTADRHRTNVMRKLNLHSVADLVRYAVRNRIIEA